VESAKLLATVLHLHRGTPYIYQGEELGMTNADFTGIDQYRDIESLNHYRDAIGRGEPTVDVLAGLRQMSRDNARTPMQWDDSPNAGFSTGTPWLPVNANYRSVNAEHEIADPHSVFHHYRALIELRHSEPTVAHGDVTMLLPDDEQLYVFTRRLGATRLLVVANFSAESLPAPIDDVAAWARSELVLGNYPEAQAVEEAGLVLRPWEARIYRAS
jgi:oligo-1,6-glucosidase